MSGRIALDLKMFKHLNSDDKSTTLQHKDGHVLTVAHKALSPEMCAQLDKLPREMPEMADGGKIQKPLSQRQQQWESVKKQSPHMTTQQIDEHLDRKKSKNYYDSLKKPAQPLADGGSVPTPPKQPPPPDPDKAKAFANGMNGGYSWAKGGQIQKENTPDAVKEANERRKESPKPYGQTLQVNKPEPKGFGKVKMMAEGGEADDKSSETPNSSSAPSHQGPVTINIGQPQAPQMPATGVSQQGTPNALMPNPSDQQPPVADSSPQAQASAPAPSATPQQQAAMPSDAQPDDSSAPGSSGPAPTPVPDESSGGEQSAMNPTAQAPVQAPQMPSPEDPEVAKQNLSQFMTKETANIAHDVATGTITPKTYGDLFHNASTPGKIRMVFGLLLGGFGGGLTHTPNAALAMMDNIINNDLHAQQKTQENKQNWLKLSQAGALNNATIDNMVKTGQLTQAQADYTKTQKDTLGFSLAQNSMLVSSFAAETKRVNEMPEGPEKDKAKQILGVMYNKIGDKVMNQHDAAAGAAAYGSTLGLLGGQQPSPDEQAFQQKINGMRMLGPDGMARAEDLQSKHISGVPEVSGQQSSRPIPEEDRKRVEAMQVLSNKGKDLLNYAQQNKLNLDKLNPVERQKILAVGAQKAEEMLNFYNNAVQNGGALTKDRLAWYDKQISKNPTSVFQDISGNNDKLKEIINSNEGRKGLLLKSLGFAPGQAAQTKTMNGVQYEKVPGGWKKVQ